VIGTPSRLRLIRNVAALARIDETRDLSIEEKDARRKWKNAPIFDCADWTPEAAKKRSVSRWNCKNRILINSLWSLPDVLVIADMTDLSVLIVVLLLFIMNRFPLEVGATGELRTAEVQTRRTHEKCVLYTFFENIFLGALLVFLCSFWMSFLLSYVCMWHAPTRTWATSELRPSLRTQVHEACAHSWSKMLSRTTLRRFHMSWRYECACAHTKPSQITLQRGFLGLTTEQLDLPFQGRRCTWRSWAYLKLQCLCSRLRIGVVKTHSDVNSWSSRSPSSEHPLLPCLPAHFLRNVERGRKWLYNTLSLECTKNYSSLNTKKYSSLCCHHLSYKVVTVTGVVAFALGNSPVDSVKSLLWIDEAKANIKPIYECRCNGRLQTKRFTRLAHTGLVVELEHLKIKTRLTNEKFASVKGECEI
jgi:hypothetical protein